jgi:hypothetical protein
MIPCGIPTGNIIGIFLRNEHLTPLPVNGMSSQEMLKGTALEMEKILASRTSWAPPWTSGTRP